MVLPANRLTLRLTWKSYWLMQCQDNATGCGIMSHVWGMMLQWSSTIKVSIELPVATRYRHDMTEKLLKAKLNWNKQQQQRHKGCAHYIILVFFVTQIRRWGLIPCFVQLSASESWDSGFESLLRHIHHLTERDTRRLTCLVSDVRDRVRNRGQDNVTTINTGSSVRRIAMYVWKLRKVY